MKSLNFILGAMLLVNIGVADAATLLSDDFNDNALDPALWSIALPLGGSSVVELNQRIEFQQRGYLITQEEFDPLSDGPLRITGFWTFGGPGGGSTDYLTIAARSDGVPSGNSEVNNGITFLVQGGFNDVEVGRRVGGVQVAVQAIENQIDVSVGDTFQFEITDDGSDVTFRFEEVGDPSSSVFLTVSDNTVFGENHVVFYNRETGTLGQLDNVLIEGTGDVESDLTAIPEPSTFTVCLLLPLFSTVLRRKMVRR